MFLTRSLPTDYHWTPAARMRFIDELARTGSVQRAAAAAGKTRDAAYKLRRRKAEAEFAQAWDAAVLVAREYVGDAILSYGFEPVEYYAVRNARTGRTGWRRVAPMLGKGYGLGLVNRLDRAAAPIERDPARRAAAKALVPGLFDRIPDDGQ